MDILDDRKEEPVILNSTITAIACFGLDRISATFDIIDPHQFVIVKRPSFSLDGHLLHAARSEHFSSKPHLLPSTGGKRTELMRGLLCMWRRVHNSRGITIGRAPRESQAFQGSPPPLTMAREKTCRREKIDGKQGHCRKRQSKNSVGDSDKTPFRGGGGTEMKESEWKGGGGSSIFRGKPRHPTAHLLRWNRNGLRNGKRDRNKRRHLEQFHS